jgi:hypothetical protein
MAGKAAKALKFVFGAAAGVAAGAGAYFMGKQAGADEARAAEASKSANRPASAKTTAPADQPRYEETPRPAMQVPAEEVVRVARDRQAYHSLINDRARDLRARIAEQAYGTVLAEAESSANGQFQAAGVEVVEGEPPAKGSYDDPTVPMASEPYERIQNALKTSKLFSTEGDDAYKPTPFSMPKS